MKSLPASLMKKLTALEQPDPWVSLLAFTLPHGRYLRVADNTEPITYGGLVYKASAFEPEVFGLSKDARMPTVTLRLQNMNAELAGWLRQSGGLEDQTLTVTLVNTNDLAADYSAFRTVYDIRGHEDGDDYIDFEIGGPNCYSHRFPFRRYMPNLCEVAFKGVLCGYVGPESACLYTLTDCRDRMGNAPRFGGTPGMRPSGLKVVT